jgi:glycosyltransferase involved in cell wall biosynthesis
MEPTLNPISISTEPLNVLFVSHDAYPHGAQYLLLTLTNWLKDKGLVNPRFLLPGPGPLIEEFLSVGPLLRFDPGEQKKKPQGTTARLLRSFCGEALDLVYLNSAASGHVIEFTRGLNVPQVVHVHELQKSIDRWVGPQKMEALREYAQMFIAASTPVADNLHEKYRIPKENLRVVDSFIRCTGIEAISDAEKRDCKSVLGLDPDSDLILGCGTTDWRKGPDLFVQAAKELRNHGPRPVQFVWVGGETQKDEIAKLKRLAAAAGIESSVKFVGEVSTPFQYMVAADVFLLPSREDPFPLVCLEAADCGVPIVCFADAGGMPDFVGSECGIVVPGLDVAAMAGAVKSLLEDDEKKRSLGENGKEKVRRQLDVSVKAIEIYQVLRGLITASRGEEATRVLSQAGKNA